jgi:DNA-binding HxlR family transcriptional regulator
VQHHPDPFATALAASLPGRPCSIAAALGLVGDKWALLIVRELLFGNHRFDQLARNTGGPRDRLAARLRDLQAANLVVRRRYQERPERFEYHLTDAGRELAPVLDSLRQWGDKWAFEQPPMVVRHSCGEDYAGGPRCTRCGERVSEADLTIESAAPGWEVSGPAEPSGRPLPAGQ